MSNSTLPGNQHADDYYRNSGDGAIAAATMALAYEQRTANLIAREQLAAGAAVSPFAEREIDARLGRTTDQ